MVRFCPLRTPQCPGDVGTVTRKTSGCAGTAASMASASSMMIWGGTFFYLGTRIDGLGTRLDGLSARLEDHLRPHTG